MPVFAFANAGVVLKGLTLSSLVSALPLGIADGLVIGKQTGVFLTTWAMVRLGWARLPEGAAGRMFRHDRQRRVEGRAGRAVGRAGSRARPLRAGPAAGLISR